VDLFVKGFRFTVRNVFKGINFVLVPLSRWTKYVQLRVTRHYLPLFDETRAFRLYDTKRRLEVIKNKVKELNKPCSVLDIGANNGYFMRKLAVEGHFCIGIEADDCYIQLGRFMIDYRKLKGIALVDQRISADNVGSLPACDVVLFMSVFQKITKQAGIENAKEVLKGIWKSTGSYLFFEMPDVLESEEQFIKDLPATGKTKEECNQSLEKFLKELLSPRSIEMIDEYDMEYRDEKRTLFLLKK